MSINTANIWSDQRYRDLRTLVKDEPRHVWLGYDCLLDCRVILKGCLRGSHSTAIDQEFLRLHGFSHPSLPRALDLLNVQLKASDGTRQTYRCFSQEYLDGKSLTELARSLTSAELLAFATQALGLLDWLQRQGLVHVDLKPDHFIRVGPRWYLIDLEQLAPEDPFAVTRETGTLAFVAPELILGTDLGKSSDVYSLGAVFYFALTGDAPPIVGTSIEEICRNLLTSPPPDIPDQFAQRAPTLAALAKTMLARSPSTRPESAFEAFQRWDAEAALAARQVSPLPMLTLTGRTALLERERVWRKQIGSERGGALLLQGPSGSGGSRVLQHLQAQLQTDERACVVLPAHAVPTDAIVDRLILSLEWMAQVLPDVSPENALPNETSQEEGTPNEANEPGCSPFSSEAFSLEGLTEKPLRQQLQRLQSLALKIAAATGEPTIVLIDNIQMCGAFDRLRLERLLPLLPGTGIGLIMVEHEPQPDYQTSSLGPAAGSNLEALTVRPFASLGVFDGAEDVDSVLKLDLTALSPVDIRSLLEEGLGAGVLSHPGALDAWMEHSEGWPGKLIALMTLRWQFPETQDWKIDSRKDQTLLPAWVESDSQLLMLVQSAAILPLAVPGLWLQLICAQTNISLALGKLTEHGILVASPLPVQSELARSEPAPLELAYQIAAPLREGMLTSLSESTRKLLSTKAADLLERRSLLGHAIEPETLGTLFVAGGQPERARPYLRRAIDRLGALGKWDRAYPLMTILLTTFQEDDPERSELSIEAASLARHCRLDEACAAYLKHALAAPEWLSQAQVTAARLALAYSLSRLQRFDEVRCLLDEQGLLTSTTNLDPLQAAHFLLLRGWLALQRTVQQKQQDLVTAEKCLIECPEECLKLGQLPLSLTLRRAHLSAALRLARDQFDDDTRHGVEEALSQAIMHQQRREEILLVNQLMEISRKQSRLVDAEQQAIRLLELTREAFDATKEAIAEHNLAMVLMDRGRVQEAYRHYDQASRLAARVGRHPYSVQNALDSAEALIEGSLLDKAFDVLQRLLPRIETLETQPGVLWAMHRLLNLRLTLRQQKLDGLKSAYESFQEMLPGLRALFLLPHLQVDLIELAVSLREEREASRLIAALGPEVFREQALKRRVHQLGSLAHRQALESGDHSTDARDAGETGAPRTEPEGSTQMSEAKRSRPKQEAKHRPSTSAEAAAGTRMHSEANPEAGASVMVQPTLPEAVLWPASERLTMLATWLETLRTVLEKVGEPDIMAQRLAQFAGQLVQGRGLVFLFDPLQPEFSGSFRISEDHLNDISSTLINEVRAQKKPLLVEDLLLKGRVMRSLRAASVRSIACVPMIVDHHCAGVIYVDSVKPWGSAASRHFELIQSLASMAAGILAQSPRWHSVPAEDVQFGLVGVSPAIKQLKQWISKVVKVKDPFLRVMLLGEPGTGKNLIARSIHENSVRSQGPFMQLSCAETPESLIQGRLFGYKKGQFTGASTDTPGLFADAKGGTLFLDEIGTAPPSLQEALLSPFGSTRSNSYNMMGNSKSLPIDFQLMTATNENLPGSIEAKRFRADLYGRLNWNTYTIPTLRERGREDILLMLSHALTRELIERGMVKRSELNGQKVLPVEPFFTTESLELLCRYSWPGNVRQLESMFKSAIIQDVLMSNGKEKITRDMVQRELDKGVSVSGQRSMGAVATIDPTATAPIEEGGYWKLKEWSEAFLAKAVRRVWEEQERNVRRTAKYLDCSRDVVYKWVPEAKV